MKGRTASCFAGAARTEGGQLLFYRWRVERDGTARLAQSVGCNPEQPRAPGDAAAIRQYPVRLQPLIQQRGQPRAVRRPADRQPLTWYSCHGTAFLVPGLILPSQDARSLLIAKLNCPIYARRMEQRVAIRVCGGCRDAQT